MSGRHKLGAEGLAKEATATEHYAFPLVHDQLQIRALGFIV
jgi:hypothetical protein